MRHVEAVYWVPFSAEEARISAGVHGIYGNQVPTTNTALSEPGVSPKISEEGDLRDIVSSASLRTFGVPVVHGWRYLMLMKFLNSQAAVIFLLLTHGVSWSM